jgi:hypothetical protein
MWNLDKHTDVPKLRPQRKKGVLIWVNVIIWILKKKSPISYLKPDQSELSTIEVGWPQFCVAGISKSKFQVNFSLIVAISIITQVCTDFDVCIKLTVFEQFRPPDCENDFGFALSRLVFSQIVFLKLKCSLRMNELFQNFDIVISDNNMDIRNFLVLFASGTAGHEASIGLRRSGL